MIFQDAMDSAMQHSRSDKDWDDFTSSLDSGLDRLESIVDDVADLREVCQDEWCEVAECLLDEATVAAFAISEPHWISDGNSMRIKSIKKKIHDLHAANKGATH